MPRARRPGPAAPDPAGTVQWVTGFDLARTDPNRARSHLTIAPPLEKKWTAKLPALASDCAVVAGAGRVYVATRKGAVLGLDLADGTVRWENARLGSPYPHLVRAGGRVLLRTPDGMAELLEDGQVIRDPVLARERLPLGGGEAVAWSGLLSLEDLSPLAPPEVGRLVYEGRAFAVVDDVLRAYALPSGATLWERRCAYEGEGAMRYDLATAMAGASGMLVHFASTPAGKTLVARDAATGHIRWQTRVHDGPTPFWVDGETVHAHIEYRGLSGLGIATGERRPEASATFPESVDDLEAFPDPVGLSPGLVWLALELRRGGDKSHALAAIELGTSRVVWKQKISGSPWLVGFPDGKVLVAHGRSLSCFG